MTTSGFWAGDKKRSDSIPFYNDSLWKNTWDDAYAIKTDDHPKQKHSLCLRNSHYWLHNAAQNNMSLDDVAMMVCKDIGCDLSYCNQIKGSVAMEWEGSSDCKSEYKNFQNCLASEKTKLSEMPQSQDGLSWYSYIQTRIASKKKEESFDMELSEDQKASIEQMNKQKQKMAESDRREQLTH